jgi:hypothetical protein
MKVAVECQRTGHGHRKLDAVDPETTSSFLLVGRMRRRDAVGMVAHKCAPALRWWPRVAAHIPSDCRLSDLEAKLEQFTMNVRRAPEWVRAAHLANERAKLIRDLRSANMVARSPAPIRSKPSAVPANDRLPPDNRNRAKEGNQ